MIPLNHEIHYHNPTLNRNMIYGGVLLPNIATSNELLALKHFDFRYIYVADGKHRIQHDTQKYGFFHGRYRCAIWEITRNFCFCKFNTIIISPFLNIIKQTLTLNKINIFQTLSKMGNQYC